MRNITLQKTPSTKSLKPTNKRNPVKNEFEASDSDALRPLDQVTGENRLIQPRLFLPGDPVYNQIEMYEWAIHFKQLSIVLVHVILHAKITSANLTEMNTS